MRRKRYWQIGGLLFLLTISWAWFAKPKTFVQQCEDAGFKLTYQSVLSEPNRKYVYFAPSAKRSALVTLLQRAGFRQKTTTISPECQETYLQKPTRVLFLWSHVAAHIYFYPGNGVLKLETSIKLQ